MVCGSHRVAALVIAVIGTVLPHPAQVLDLVIVVMDAIVVDLSKAGEECGPGAGDVAASGMVDVIFLGNRFPALQMVRAKPA
jgi:hypothetical protein